MHALYGLSVVSAWGFYRKWSSLMYLNFSGLHRQGDAYTLYQNQYPTLSYFYRF
jgi:hypothetical protein